jgi:hypothetical protein
MTVPATMQSKRAMWGHLPLPGERSGANDRAGDDAELSDEEERRQ